MHSLGFVSAADLPVLYDLAAALAYPSLLEGFGLPGITLFPGLAIVLTVLGLNLMGDGLRDMFDPKLRRARS